MSNTSTGRILLIVGTRPEGIKMLPLYFALKQAGYAPLLCSTNQHDQLLDEVFTLFNVKPDIDLGVMRLGQDLFYLTQSILQKTKEVFIREKPSLVIVQGDTTSTMAAALAAFYLHIPVAHVEAGLRTDDIYAPFPEEMNRRFVSLLAKYHFAPTQLAMKNLIGQGIDEDKVFCTGNTVVDALRIIKEAIETKKVVINSLIEQKINWAKENNKKIIVLTVHRRESFNGGNGGIDAIFRAIKTFLSVSDDVLCIYPYHPNPHVVQAIEQACLSAVENIFVCEALSYKDMIYLLTHADLVLTDSGGIQEEAVSLGKQVLILREKTERIEGVLAGFAHLVGTDPQKILTLMSQLLAVQHDLTNQTAVYGDGYAAQKIVSILHDHLQRVEYGAIEDVMHLPIQLQKKEIAMKKVCIVGLGYIGLPTAIIATDHGFEVVGFDIDEQKCQKINSGDPVIHEPEIYEKLQLALASGRLTAVAAITGADYFIIAVPTPFKENKKADLSYVFDAAMQIAHVLKVGDCVIIESTIPVGATQQVAQFLQEKTGLQAGIDFYVCHCPERVLPGKIFHELIENDRIIGGINQLSMQAAKDFYKQFVRGQLFLTDATTAEMVKLIENSSRDAQIAFANQVASMAYSIGLNPYEVIELANKHPRVKILNPGCGVGGHCIAVDPWFLIESFPEHTQLLHAARTTNDNKPIEVINCVQSAVAQLQKTIDRKAKVAVFGLTYKPDIDDLRESPALFIAQKLFEQKNIELLVVEPHINKNKLDALFGNAIFSATDAAEQADILLFLVGHTRFKALDLKSMQHKKILDFCGLTYKPAQLAHGNEQLFWPAQSMMDFFTDPIPLVDEKNIINDLENN